MKNLILILLLTLASCQSIYKTTTTYTTDSLGNKIKTIKKEYRENTSDSYIEINTYPEYGYPFGRPYYSPFYSPFYRPYYRPYYRPNYGPPYTPRPIPRNQYYSRPSISGPRTQIHQAPRNEVRQAPIRNFPKVDHRR